MTSQGVSIDVILQQPSISLDASSAIGHPPTSSGARWLRPIRGAAAKVWTDEAVRRGDEATVSGDQGEDWATVRARLLA